MASDDSVEVTAPSVEEAIIVGLTRLMATRDEVEIEVLDEGSHGFLGIGSREAKVRLTRAERPVVTAKPAPPKPAAEPVVKEPEPKAPVQAQPSAPVAPPVEKPAPVRAEPQAAVKPTPRPTAPTPKPGSGPAAPQPSAAGGLDRAKLEAVAQDIVASMLPGLDVTSTIEWVDEDRPTLWVSLSGKDADALVGPRARNLHSVQYLFRALIYHQLDGDYNVVVDADGYRKRRRRSIESMAQSKADQAVAEGQTVRLRPMPAHERRIIHMILRDDERVSTESVGRGRDRAVTIIPVSASDNGKH